MADVDGEFVTVLLQINLAIRTDFFRALFYCTIHKSRIKQRALVANVATNFPILIANTENLGALATVSGAISCPGSYTLDCCGTSRPPEVIIDKALFSSHSSLFFKYNHIFVFSSYFVL